MSGAPNDQALAAAATPVWVTGAPGSTPGVPVPPTPPPATIAGSGTWDSGVMSANGYNKLAAAATLSQTGTLTIQRYINAAGTIALGAAVTQAMTAATPATVWVNDGQPAASWRVTVANSSGSTGNLTGVALLEQA